MQLMCLNFITIILTQTDKKKEFRFIKCDFYIMFLRQLML